MELAERITGRVAELTGEAGLLRKQLADAERELERLVIAGQVITQLMADDAAAAGEPGVAGPAQRDFGLLVEAVTAAAAETGGAVTCMMAAQRVGLDVSGRQAENVRAKLKRLED